MTGSPSSSTSKRIAGSALTRSPISMSEARIGVPTTSRTTRMPSPRRCSRGRRRAAAVGDLVGRGAEVAQHHDDGYAEQADRASSELRTSGRRPMPDSSRPRASASQRLRAVLVGRGGGVAHLDDLVVAHQLARPLDHADADEQQGQAQASRRARRSRRPARGTCRGSSPIVEREVGDDEQHDADRREDEQGRDLALGPLLGLRVDVGRPPLVRREARVGERLRQIVGAGIELSGAGGCRGCRVMPRPSPSSSVWCGRRSNGEADAARRCRRARRTCPR